MSKHQMLINYVPGEECRIAITEDGKLEELYQERASSESHVGNIYKGRVTNVEPSIQAAFVDFGLERNGFLHISDLHPKYFPGQSREQTEKVGEKTPRRDRPPIQKCLRRGQEVLVQVLKEGIGTKGPTLTSYLSIPGRYLVMMLHMERLGVSRKVEDDEARREMRKVLDELDPPDGFGFIIRTAGMGRTKTELKRDLAYLQRLWKNIERRRGKLGPVGELYAESDLVIRTIRDVYSSDIERIVVDNEQAARRAVDFLAIANPRTRPNVLVYRDAIPLFHRFDIERQIENINSRTVPLPSGGSLVIDSTEALVAIDVNSGKMRDHRDADTTAYKTNLEAVDEICRQLRLRDLGGVVVNDLIDMRDPKHRRAVEQRFRNNLKKDRARTRVAAISPFGLLEMTRQRMRPSLKHSLYVGCEHCGGTGAVKSSESVVLDVMRRLALVLSHDKVARLELTVSPDVAFQLLNRKRGHLVRLEQQHNSPVLVRVNAAGPADFLDLQAYDSRGSLLDDQALASRGDNNPESCLIDVHELRTPSRSTADADTSVTDDDLPPIEDDEFEDSVEVSPPVDQARQQATEQIAQAQQDQDEQSEEGQGKRRRRRRRGGRRRRRRRGDEQTDGSTQPQDQSDASSDSDAQDQDQSDASSDSDAQDQDQDAASRERVNQPQQRQPRDRTPKGTSSAEPAQSDTGTTPSDESPVSESQDRQPQRRRRTESQAASNDSTAAPPAPPVTPTVSEDIGAESDAPAASTEGDEAAPPKPRRRRRSRSRRSRDEAADNAGQSAAADAPTGDAGTPDNTAASGDQAQPATHSADTGQALRKSVASDKPAADKSDVPASDTPAPKQTADGDESALPESEEQAPRPRRRRRRRSSSKPKAQAEDSTSSPQQTEVSAAQQADTSTTAKATDTSVPSTVEPGVGGE